jgi:hypothetical protein
LSISNYALDLIDDLRKDKAILITKLGNLACYLHKSSASNLRLANPESSTNPAIEGSLSACIIAVIAPIDLPHNPIVDTLLDSLKYLITIAKSSLSYHPREIYLPSDNPQPEKSKENTYMF